MKTLFGLRSLWESNPEPLSAGGPLTSVLRGAALAVLPPGFTHGATAQLLGEVPQDPAPAAAVQRSYGVALGVLSWGRRGGQTGRRGDRVSEGWAEGYG